MAYTPPTPYAPLTGQVSYGTGLQFIDEVLSNVAKQFAPEGHIYDEVVTPISVQYRSGRYPVFDPSTFFAAPAMEVADDAETPLYDFNWSHDIYLAQVRRGATRMTQEELLQANPALRLDYSKTRGLLTLFANAREIRLATRLRAQSNGGQFTNPVLTPAVKWDAGSTATIQTDVIAGQLVAMKACGKRPNTMIIDWEVAAVIANDPTVKTQLQYRVGPEMMSTAEFISNGDGVILPRKLWGLNVVVADGVFQNTNRPGQAMNLVGTWNGNCRLIYRDPNPQWGVPGTVYSFRAPVTGTSAQPPDVLVPSGAGGAEPGGIADWAVVDRYFTVDPPGENIRVRECVDERVVAPELGVEIGPVLTGGSAYDSSEY